MTISKLITRESVLAAANEIDVYGVPIRRQSTGYFAIIDGKRYPPKYLVSLACRLATGKELSANDFSGGNETNGFLKQLGFELVPIALLDSTADADQDPTSFQPVNLIDARKRIDTSIVLRRGQTQFRTHLLEIYERKCAVTECSIEDILEAAHIVPYLGDHTNNPSNGVLLRSDIHTLFDLNLITISDADLRLSIDTKLIGSEYESLDGRSLRSPKGVEINREAIRQRQVIFARKKNMTGRRSKQS